MDVDDLISFIDQTVNENSEMSSTNNSEEPMETEEAKVSES